MIKECVVVLSLAVMAASHCPSSGCVCAMIKGALHKEKKLCLRGCTRDYSPMCGFNPCKAKLPEGAFKTFPNTCELDMTGCDGPGNLYYPVYEGVCDEMTTSTVSVSEEASTDNQQTV